MNAIPEIYQERFKLLSKEGYDLHRTEKATSQFSRFREFTPKMQERELDYVFVRNSSPAKPSSPFLNTLRNLFKKEKVHVVKILPYQTELDPISSPSDHIPVLVKVKTVERNAIEQKFHDIIHYFKGKRL